MLWQDPQWIELGRFNNFNLDLFAYDDGNGMALYAMGNFNLVTLPGGATLPARGFAKWNGQTWTAPMPERFRISFVRSAASFDDGSGPALYALGSIYENEIGIPGVKKWDGHTWTSIGQRTPEPGIIPAYAVLHTFDDGRGEALYLGGSFTNINSVPCRGICRFDGSTWETLGPGISGGEIYDITSITTPHGPSLFVVGDFQQAGGGLSRRMAQWVGCPSCYANCDNSTVHPILNVDDFTCFINKFAMQDPYANCDQSTTAPVFNIDDFTCFITRFAQGCP